MKTEAKCLVRGKNGHHAGVLFLMKLSDMERSNALIPSSYEIVAPASKIQMRKGYVTSSLNGRRVGVMDVCGVAYQVFSDNSVKIA